MNNPWSTKRAFTIVEMLVATAVFILLMAIVAGVLAQISRIWTERQGQNLRQQSGRILLDFLARDIEQAMLPLDGSVNSLQFVVNPSNLGTAFSNRDNIFFQAPIAGDKSQGEVAEVGYFVQWNGSTAQLCRFFINPSSPDYKIYSSPANWLTSNIITSAAPATPAEKYKGLLAENVVGLWINAYRRDGSLLLESGQGYDTRDNSNSGTLPPSIEISLLVIDPVTSKRMSGDASLLSMVKAAVSTSTSASQCLAKLPDAVRTGANSFAARIQPKNAR